MAMLGWVAIVPGTRRWGIYDDGLRFTNLPVPAAHMDAQKKGALLLRYLEAKEPLWDDENLMGFDFRNAHLNGEHLVQADFSNAMIEGAVFESCQLIGASFESARLEGARFAFSRLHDARFTEAEARRCAFHSTELVRVDFTGCDLSRAKMESCDLTGTRFDGADVTSARIMRYERSSHEMRWGNACRGVIRSSVGARLNWKTVKRSEWAPSTLAQWARHGLVVNDMKRFPDAFREILGAAKPSLVLRFPRRLAFLNKAVVESVLASLLGENHALCTCEYTPTPTGGALVRLSGLSTSELAALADRLAEFFARQSEDDQFAAIQRAADLAAGRAVETALPAAYAPIATLHARMGQQLHAAIRQEYAAVEATEVTLPEELVELLKRLDAHLLEQGTDRSDWAVDLQVGRAVRKGGYAVGTGALGSGLVELLMWLASNAG